VARLQKEDNNASLAKKEAVITLSTVEVRAMAQLSRPSLQSFDYAQDDLALFLT